jgi:hypothetical protein
MPEDPVDTFISEQKALDAKRQELIREVLRQKEAAIKAFDDRLAKLGHTETEDHPRKRSHHKAANKPKGS